MSDPNATSNQGPPGRPGGGAAGFSALRGAALIALAVIIGVVLLNEIDDGTDGPTATGGSSTSTTSSTSPTSGGSTDGSGTSSTTKPGAVPPAFVKVRVLNGSGVGGAAGQLTNTLKSKGYQTLVASDAPAREGTVVYAKSGKNAECSEVAKNVTGAEVEPMPTSVPGGQDADCIVVIGS